MSRQLRHKARSVPARKSVRRAPSTTEESSDDEAYAAVDQISDSDEDEPDVEKVEERAIIYGDDTPRPAEDDEEFAGFSDYHDEVLDGDLPLFGQDAVITGADWGTQDTAIEDDGGTTTDEDTPRVRRVRFEDSDDEIDDTFDDIFPDIFYDKDNLDPGFRRQIEPDDVSEDGSYWEFDDRVNALLDGEDGQDYSDSDSAGSSGYETDEGDTTDEDLPEEAHYAQPRKVLHRRLSNDSTGSEESIPVNSPARRPRLYSWKHNEPHTPFGIIHSDSKKLIMFNYYSSNNTRRYSLESAPVQQFPQTPMSSHRSSIVESSPMISNSGNVMMSAMHDQTLGLGLNGFSGAAVGPLEAFYPFTSINADGTITQDTSSAYDTDHLSMTMEPANLEEFFNFSDVSEGTDVEEVDEPTTSNSDAPISSTPVRPTTASSEDQVHPLINHFSTQKGVVGSWRQKQNTHALLNRNIVTEDSLAFNGNQFETIKGVKSGRLQHANTPITPVRRQRSMSTGFQSSPLGKRKYEEDFQTPMKGIFKRAKPFV